MPAVLQVVWDFPRHAAEGFHNLNLTKLGWERHGQWEPQDSSEEPPPRKAASGAAAAAAAAAAEEGGAGRDEGLGARSDGRTDGPEEVEQANSSNDAESARAAGEIRQDDAVDAKE